MSDYPIIYVRGFAATQTEIEDTVSDPYMGFNLGSTRSRQSWSGEFNRFFFESPLVRLMNEHGYQDAYQEGYNLLADPSLHPLPEHLAKVPIAAKSVVIYRYYEPASNTFGNGKTPSMEEFAEGLSDLIIRLREKVCENPNSGLDRQSFRVYLVAHSMGGLICRTLLQNPNIGDPIAKAAVDKLFTYATPHRGIDMKLIGNVPGWMSFGDVDNFNRQRMEAYLDLPKGNDLGEIRHFPAERVFNLVGTNSHDYLVANGLSSALVGDASDGLVRISNATTLAKDAAGNIVQSPRAFVHRSHSGYYGIVNSEEGYQNLVRFLFGKVRVDGYLDIADITLPIEVEKQRKEGKQVHASYHFEVAATVRGAHWQLTRREQRENSAIFRTYQDLFPKDSASPDPSMAPHLFSLYLDPQKSVKANKSVSFAFDLKLLVPDYQVDGKLFLKRHYEGGYILQERYLIEAIPDSTADGGWRIRYGTESANSGKPTKSLTPGSFQMDSGETAIRILLPIKQNKRPGLVATLRIETQPWS